MRIEEAIMNLKLTKIKLKMTLNSVMPTTQVTMVIASP